MSNAVTPIAPATAQATPATPTPTAGNASALVRFTAPANGGSAITGYSVRVINGTTRSGWAWNANPDTRHTRENR